MACHAERSAREPAFFTAAPPIKSSRPWDFYTCLMPQRLSGNPGAGRGDAAGLMGGPRAEVFASQPRRSGGSPRGSKAGRLVADFCQNVPATRVVPSQQELDDLWQECLRHRPGCVASALAGQLAVSPKSHDWQPNFRALRVLVHLYREGVAGRALAEAVMAQAEELVRALAQIPQCQEDASWILLVASLKDVVQPGHEVAAASDGGLPHFTKGKAEPPAPAGAAREARQKMAPAGKPPASVDLLSLAAGDEAPAGEWSSPPRQGVSTQEIVGDLSQLVWTPEPRGPADPGPAPVTPAKHPEYFRISHDEHGGENLELNEMFAFRPRQVPFIPAVCEAGLPRAPDPFAFLEAHVRAA